MGCFSSKCRLFGLDAKKSAGDAFRLASEPRVAHRRNTVTFPKKELESIWAPWRVEYFERKEQEHDFLSRAAAATDDEAHLVLYRGARCFLILNRYPYAVGHLMAAPYRKVGELAGSDREERLELWDLAELGQRVLRSVMRAQGFNVGLNLGSCAGAGVEDHLHLHIVPRWEADHNFMPVLAGTRVMPEALPALYRKLRLCLVELGVAEKT